MWIIYLHYYYFSHWMSKMLLLCNKTCEMQWIVMDFCARCQTDCTHTAGEHAYDTIRYCYEAEVRPDPRSVWIQAYLLCTSQSALAKAWPQLVGVEERMNSCGRCCSHKDDESDSDHPQGVTPWWGFISLAFPSYATCLISMSFPSPRQKMNIWKLMLLFTICCTCGGRCAKSFCLLTVVVREYVNYTLNTSKWQKLVMLELGMTPLVNVPVS